MKFRVLSHCMTNQEFALTNFSKNSVKSTCSLKIYSFVLTKYFSVRPKCLFFPHCLCGNFGFLLPRFFRKNSVKLTFYKNFSIYWFDGRKICLAVNFHFPLCTVLEITEIISHFFGRKFVKATFSWKKLLKNWFHEIFFRWERISRFSTLWSVHCDEAEIYLSETFHLPNSAHMDITKVLYCSETIPEINLKFRQINSARTLF